jgi:serine/threonine protein kinase
VIQTEARGMQAQPPVIFEDHLGARFEAVSPDGDPVEVLELKDQFAGIPAFEFALRKRVNTLTTFKDPSFASARGVRLGGGLAIVSDRVRGARLSTILAAFENDLIPVEFNAAVCVLRQLVSAVAVLHETMPEICHGALSPERIVITPEGRVVIVEHMLGSALEALHYSDQQYWEELRIAVPKTAGPACFDQRSDVLQIGLVALALIHGRSLNIEEYPVPAASLAERAWAATASGGLEPLPSALRMWLAKTLQLEPKQAFGTATAVWSELKQSLSQHNQPAELNALKSALSRYGFDVVHAPPAAGIRPSSNAEGTPLRTPVPGAPAPVAAAHIAASIPASIPAPVPASIPTPVAAVPAFSTPEASKPAPAREVTPSPTPARTPLPAPRMPVPSATPLRTPVPSTTPVRTQVPPAASTPARPFAHPAPARPFADPTPVRHAAEQTPARPGADPTPVKPIRVPATVRPPAAQADLDHVIRAKVRDAADRQMALDADPPPTTRTTRARDGGDGDKTERIPRPMMAATPKPQSGDSGRLASGHVGAAAPKPFSGEPHAPAAPPKPFSGEPHVPAAPPKPFPGEPQRAHDKFAIQEEPDDMRHNTPWWRRRAVAAVLFVAALAGAGVAGRSYLGESASAAVPGKLVINTDPQGIPVVLDGKRAGQTPVTLEVSAGEHVLTLLAEAGPRTIPVTITAGATVQQFVEVSTQVIAQTGQLQIRSEPSGARVVVDGTPRGNAPVTVADLAPGPHTVEVSNEMGSIRQDINVEAGVTSSLVVPMTTTPQGSVSGWISVTSPVDVQIYEDSRLVGSSRSERLMVSVGRHDLDIVNEALGFRQRRSVNVTAGQTAGIRLDWPNGSMAINAQPWAEVFIDGERIGETPIGNVPVPVGTHEVVFRHPELGEQTVRATVTVGTPARLSVDLRKR